MFFGDLFNHSLTDVCRGQNGLKLMNMPICKVINTACICVAGISVVSLHFLVEPLEVLEPEKFLIGIQVFPIVLGLKALEGGL